MTATIVPHPATAAPEAGTDPGVAVEVLGVRRTAGATTLLHDVTFSVAPGELVALVGGSGAGKTTLLETMAGLAPPSAGAVLHDGRPATVTGGVAVGYVPQDDIIHRELPLRRTLRYAAGLRLPAGTPPAGLDAAVDAVLRDLDLADRAHVRVGALSGGQRKRASIAVELLTRPHVLFLDEPTSGLDPATAAEVLGVLRRLAGQGVTVVLTTHDPADIDACDRVVFLASGGHLAFVGTPAAARAHFDVAELASAYRRLATEATPQEWARRFAAGRPLSRPGLAPSPNPLPPPRPRVGAVRQWALLTGRNAEVMVRNRLTLAILAGSPALVTAMMAVLFRPGGFEATGAASIGPAQTVFWVAFAGFFFGLTYGLLQIVGEMAVLRRERWAGLGVGAYVASKVAVLAPVLGLVAAGMLGVLRVLDRLPAMGWETALSLFATLWIESLAALALGLLASALVADAAQATLALPMLCFPQVLFAGAVVPVGEMAAPGRGISVAMATRWSFESLGRGLRLDGLTASMPTMAGYADAFSGPVVTGCAVLAATGVTFLAATVAVLRRRTRPGTARR